MTENFLFKALFISLAAHTAVLCVAFFNRINDPHYKAAHQNRIEISYKPFQRPVDIREYPIRPAQHLDLSNNQRFFSDGSIPVSLVKDRQSLPFGMLDERRPEHMRSMELSPRVAIMPVTSEKINDPVYVAYQNIVHDRLQEKVYEKHYDKMGDGSVYLTFLLNDQGVLVAAQIIQEKTSASAYLQEMAMKSLRDASPFPAFLKGMNLKEYSCDIEIQYHVSD